MGFITSAAPNAGAIMRNEPHNRTRIGPTLRERVGKVLALAAHHEVDGLAYSLTPHECAAPRSGQEETRELILLVMTTLEREELRAFRQHVYRTFGSRRDALFELLDAILTAPPIETPAHLSLTATCQRGWGSRYAARNVGTLDLPALERLVASYPLASARAWYGQCLAARRSPNEPRPRLPSPCLPGIPTATHRGRLELFLAGAGAQPLFALDGTPAAAADAARGERQDGGRRTESAPAAALTAAPPPPVPRRGSR